MTDDFFLLTIWFKGELKWPFTKPGENEQKTHQYVVDQVLEGAEASKCVPKKIVFMATIFEENSVGMSW
mgnify:CR=1 FL=1